MTSPLTPCQSRHDYRLWHSDVTGRVDFEILLKEVPECAGIHMNNFMDLLEEFEKLEGVRPLGMSLLLGHGRDISSDGSSSCMI